MSYEALKNNKFVKVLSEEVDAINGPSEVNIYVIPRKGVSTKKVPSKWVDHVRQSSKDLGISYKEALSDPRVKEAYKKKSPVINYEESLKAIETAVRAGEDPLLASVMANMDKNKNFKARNKNKSSEEKAIEAAILASQDPLLASINFRNKNVKERNKASKNEASVWKKIMKNDNYKKDNINDTIKKNYKIVSDATKKNKPYIGSDLMYN